MRKPRYYYGPDISIKTVDMLAVNDNLLCEQRIIKTKHFPRITICGIYDDETETLSFGAAICSPKDRFVKSIGRDLAFKRANEEPCKIVSDVPIKDLLDRFYEEAFNLEIGITNGEE